MIYTHHRFVRWNTNLKRQPGLPPLVPPLVSSILSVAHGHQSDQTPPAQDQPPATSPAGGGNNSPLATPQPTTPPGGGGETVPPAGGGDSPPAGGGGTGNPESSPRPGISGAGNHGAVTQSAAAGASASGSPIVNPGGDNPGYGQSNTPSRSSRPGQPSGSGTGAGSGPGPGSGSADPSSSASGGSSHRLSPGATFALAFFFLVAITVVIFIALRRRQNSLRRQRHQRWFGVDRMLGFGVTSGSENATLGSGTRSARSSFATNIDQGLTPSTSRADLDFIPIPPMAEIRQNLIHPEVPTEMLVNVDTGSNRSSVSSCYSGTQYVNESDRDLGLPTPMVVSPFTPSESFSFPQPPARPTTADGEMSIAEDAKASSLWLSKPITPPPIVEMPSPAVLAGGPPPSPAHVPPRGSTANPFADPVSTHSHDGVIGSEFSALETVRRRFSPTLGDELLVEPGEQVTIRKVYDDGWAYVEKGVLKGLVPLNCLREQEQDIPAFLASRRISSYGGLAL